MKNKIFFSLLIIILILVIFIAFLCIKNSSNNVIKHEKNAKVLSEELVKKGDYHFDKSTANSYDIKEAFKDYQKALELNPNNERALYQITRVYYVKGDHKNSNIFGEQYIQKYPNNKRIHYVLGLNDAYDRKFDKSIKHFKQFIDSYEVNEAGYLDIAWVYFQKGDYKTAKKYLEDGIKRFGDNVWLNLSLAMNKFNLGEDKKEVMALLDKAEEQSEKLTYEIWKHNYSSNNPRNYGDDIKKLKNLIQINKKIVKGISVDYDAAELTSYGLKIEALSPKGITGGYTVSACCASNKGDICYTEHKNDCNVYGTGTIQCDGSCNAYVPRAYETAGSYKRLNVGDNIYIYKFGDCKKITNNGSGAIFIPLNSEAEWTTFLSKHPTYISHNTPDTYVRTGGRF